jgi:phage-related protein
MKRLLKDAEKISGIKYDISSFADISEAIHVIQQDLEISGISYEEAMQRVANGEMTMEEAMKAMGTTAREAATTIEGSLSMMKASWENLVVGMADENANMDTLINNFVESTALAAQNLIPCIEQTLAGIGQLITAMAPIIAEALPVLVESLLPTIITAGISLITALANAIVTALPAIYTALMEGVQIILVQVFGVSEEKAGEFADGVTSFFVKIKDGFMALVKSAQTEGTFLNEVWTGLQNAAKLFGEFLSVLFTAISTAFTWCVEQINTEGTYLNTIWENIKTFISAAVGIIQNVITAFTAILRGDWSSAWDACLNIVNIAGDAIVSIVLNLIEWIAGFLSNLVEAGYELITSLEGGMMDKFAQLFTLVGGWVTDNIINPILDMGTDLYNAGVNLLNKFWDGLESIWDKISNWWDGLKLSDKTANVNTNAGGKGYATGLNYVPYDNFPALLHRGEAVLTSAEANVWRKGGLAPAVAGGITINQYIQSVPQTPVELANATEAYFEQARWML